MDDCPTGPSSFGAGVNRHVGELNHLAFIDTFVMFLVK